MRHAPFRAALLLIFLVLHGCWDARELTSLAIVAAVGIDLDARGAIQVTVQIIKPGEIKGGGGGGAGGGEGGGVSKQAFWIGQATGKTVAEAFRNFVPLVSRQLYLAHNQMIVFGEEAARRGILPFIDYFVRDGEPRETTWILVAQGKASEIVGYRGRNELEKIPAMELNRSMDVRNIASLAPGVSQHQFLSRLMSKTTATYAARIRLADVPDPGATSAEGGSAKQSGQTGGSGESGGEGSQADGSQKRQGFELAGTAIFKGDKLVGYLNQTETRGLLWVLGQVGQANVSGRLPRSDQRVDFQVLYAKSQVAPLIIDGRLLIEVEVTALSDLHSQTDALDLSKTKDEMKDLEQIENRVIESEIASAIAAAHRYQADIFGFGETVHRRYKKQWKKMKTEWDRLFLSTPIRIKVKSRLQGTGLDIRPIKPE